MNAEIIAIGSELLTPYRLDTNSLFITNELNQVGVRVVHKAVVGDTPDEMLSSFRLALDRADVVVSCGGLGPTDDDRTRQTVSELLGRKLLRSEEVLQKLQERFRRFGRTMPEINTRQALVIEGATVMPNPRGTAPGQWIEAKGHILILLPGVPSELRALMEAEVTPRLAKLGIKQRRYTRDLRIVGLFESEVEQRVSRSTRSIPIRTPPFWLRRAASSFIRAFGRMTAPSAEARLDELVRRMALVLGENLVSTHGETIEDIVARVLMENRATIAVAESCTGGLLAERLTNLPGSSAYFLGGIVCYSNDLKTRLVGVPAEMIEAKGAVSSEVALALAAGIRNLTGATLGIGITGVAGPGGGTPDKPVGLVHIGIADEHGPREKSFRFPGDRERIRFFATQNALDAVRRYFLFPQRA